MNKIIKINGIAGAAFCSATLGYFVADKHHEKREIKRRKKADEDEALRQKKVIEELKRW